MSGQGSFFDRVAGPDGGAVYKAKARKADPGASRQAAKVLTGQAVAGLAARVLDHLAAAGEDGATTAELAAALGVGRDSVSPRMAALEAAGDVERTPARRDGRTVWRRATGPRGGRDAES